MYLNLSRSNRPKKRRKTARLHAKKNAKNRRRVNRMHGRKLSRRI